VQQLGREEALRDTLYTAHIKDGLLVPAGMMRATGVAIVVCETILTNFCHDELNRGLVVRFLKELGVEG